MRALRRLVVASHNRGKAAELAALLADLEVEVLSLESFPGFVLPPETGATFADNASLKATATAGALGEWALGEDSGLVVPALDGAPGLHSSRVAASDAERIAWLLERMKGLPDEQRAAYFVCAVALAEPGGRLRGAWEGRTDGRILTAPQGRGGFGYDPVFFYPPAGRSFAEMSPEGKSAVSHRGQALRRLKQDLPELLPQ